MLGSTNTKHRDDNSATDERLGWQAERLRFEKLTNGTLRMIMAVISTDQHLHKMLPQMRQELRHTGTLSFQR
jgi:hypothetical protein